MKSVTKKQVTAEKSDSADRPGHRILKVAACPSLSGKSTLSYHVGVNENGELQFRVVENTGNGMWNKDWVPLRAIQAAFDKTEKGEVVTADALMPLFRGRSMNTPFFVFAALKNEGFVRVSATKKRGYDRADAKEVAAVVQALLEGKGAPAKGGKVKTVKTAPEKTPGVSKKKANRPS